MKSSLNSRETNTIICTKSKRLSNEAKLRIYCCEYISQGDLLAIAFKNPDQRRRITVFQRKPLKEIKTFVVHDDAITSLIYLPKAKFLVSCSLDKNLKLWRADRSFRHTQTFEVDFEITCLDEISKEDILVAAGRSSKIIALYYAGKTRHVQYVVGLGHFNFSSIKYLSNEKMLVLVTASGKIILFDWLQKVVATTINASSIGSFSSYLRGSFSHKFIITPDVTITRACNRGSEKEGNEIEILSFVKDTDPNRQAKDGQDIGQKICIALKQGTRFKIWKIQKTNSACLFKCSDYKGEDFFYFQMEKTLWKVDFSRASITVSFLQMDSKID